MRDQSNGPEHSRARRLSLPWRVLAVGALLASPAILRFRRSHRAPPAPTRVTTVAAAMVPTLLRPHAQPAPAPVPAPPPPARTNILLGEIDARTPQDAIPADVLDRIRAEEPDVLVVLGAKVRRGRPGRHLTQRLRTAVRIHAALDGRPMLLLSGGKGEAQAMRDYMLAHGIPREQLILETRSRNTVQNARFSMAILERHPERYRSALVVTTLVRGRRRVDDHARRALANFMRYRRHVHVSAVSINADPDIQPRVYVTRRVRSSHRASL